MKKNLSLSILFWLIINLASAQVVLTAEIHSLESGDLHKVNQATWVNPGEGGENQVWDFSVLSCQEEKSTIISGIEEIPYDLKNIGADVAIQSKNSFFLFSYDNAQLEQTGVITEKSIISYEKNPIKMVYPFAYGDNYAGDFIGRGVYYDVTESNIIGTHTIKADGFGTLILPNNVLTNVLRVKHVIVTTEVMACNSTESVTEKYYWYSADYRYPVFAVVWTKSESEAFGVVENKFSQYTEAVLARNTLSNSSLDIEHSVNIFPNPFKESTTISCNLAKETELQIELFAQNGVKIKTLQPNLRHDAGNHSIKFNGEGIAPGTYYVNFIIGDKKYVEKVVLVD